VTDEEPRPGDIPSILRTVERDLDRLEVKVEYGLAIHASDIAQVREEVKALAEARTSLVSIERYRPVERVVFGFIGLVLIAVVTSLVALVVRAPG